MLKGWAKNDVEKYNSFYKNFGSLFKTGINTDFSNREKIIELLRFESSSLTAGEVVSLKDYCSRMRDGQSAIYYLSGDNRDLLEKNPNMEYFRKKEIEVLYLTDPVDIFIFCNVAKIIVNTNRNGRTTS